MRANGRNRAWIVVVLLFIFMLTNFADKAAIGVMVALPLLNWVIVRLYIPGAPLKIALTALGGGAAFGELRHQQCRRR